MKQFFAVFALLCCAGAEAGPVAKVVWRPAVAKVAWEKPFKQHVRTVQADSLPGKLDGSDLPDDLFGGVPDPRGGSGGNGNTMFVLPR